MLYDKTRFINNVYILAKQQKIKIGELEAGCGVSVGYFPRLRQGSENASPSADLLLNLAQKLSVSVNALLSFDFTQPTESERKLLNYLEKLRFETETRKLSWQEDALDASSHPLLTAGESLLSEEEMAEDGLPGSVSLSLVHYRSVFRPDLEDLVPAAVYRCFFPGKRVLYLAVVSQTGQYVSSLAQRLDLELVMTDPRVPDPLPLARLDHETPGCLDKPLADLLSAVKKVIALPALRPEAEAIVDDYLK